MNEIGAISSPKQDFNYFKMSHFNVCQEKDVLLFAFRLSFHQIPNVSMAFIPLWNGERTHKDHKQKKFIYFQSFSKVVLGLYITDKLQEKNKLRSPLHE